MEDSAKKEGPRFCSHCGQPVAPGELFCSHCGQRIAAPPVDSQPQPVVAGAVSGSPAASNTAKTSSQQVDQSKGNQKALLILLLIGVLGVAAVMFFLKLAVGGIPDAAIHDAIDNSCVKIVEITDKKSCSLSSQDEFQGITERWIVSYDATVCLDSNRNRRNPMMAQFEKRNDEWVYKKVWSTSCANN